METSNAIQMWLTKFPELPLPCGGQSRLNHLGRLLAFVGCLFVAANIQAANQIWTNAPADGNWANTNNWAGQAAPGVVNVLAQGITLNAVNNDVATFNAPIYNGIGGAGNPIVPDDGTVTNSRSRTLGSIVFDGASCGAYVFYSPSAPVFVGALNATNPETGFLNLCQNGSIVMNATVTNPETFLVPIAIRLPSSMWGAYSFINNSTTPTATLFLNGVTNYSSNLRSTTFYLDGSNTGTNTIGGLSKGTTTSTTALQGIVKQGSGTWILSGTNDFAGNASAITMAVNGGLLIVKNPGAFGAATSATVQSNGTLQIDGITLGLSTLNLSGQGTIRMNGSATVNGVAVGTSASDSPSLATTSSGDVMTVLTNSGGYAASSLHVTGPGTVSLAGAGSYAGTWSLDAGTCSISDGTALTGSHSVTVGAGATLDLSPLGAVTYTWVPTRLGGSGTGTTVGTTAATIKADASATIDVTSKGITLNYTPTSFTGDSTHPALYISQGTLSMGNNEFVVTNASGTPLGIGTYVLIYQASGSIATAGGYVADVEGSGTAAGTLGTIQVNGSDVDLIVAAYTSKNLVWQGGNPDSKWDNSTTTNWLDNGSPSVFNVSDHVLFNSTGSSYPTVNLFGTLSPSSVTVDTSGNNYTFSGSGYIAGGTGLTKVGSGTLVMQTVNAYTGDTVVSNGTLQLGADNVIPGTLYSGQVAVQSPGVLDLSNYDDTIGGLSGNGTVDCASGGTPTLTVGNNNASGTFSGTIKNTSGALGLTKNGSGTEMLSGVNSYTGPTIVNAGTLSILSSPLVSGTMTLNGGTLDLGANLMVSNLSGVVGTTIANNSSASPVRIFSHGASDTSSLIQDGTGGGAFSIAVLDGSLQLNEASTYSGGTYVASGATLAVGVINGVHGGQAGTGDIVASNNATISIPTALSTPEYLTTPISTVDGATVTFTSGEYGNAWQCPFDGSATATNIFSGGDVSFAANMQFSNFLGTVIITNGQIRNYQHGGPVGGDETSFVFTNGGGMFNRGNGDVHLGSLSGNGVINGGGAGGTYTIGANNRSTVYSGEISGPNNIIKTGTGTLLLNGGQGSNIIIYPFGGGIWPTYEAYYGTNMLLYIGSTTVSNGVLALAVPALLTNSTPVTLAAPSAVLDASDMGYISNEVTTNGGFAITNQFPVTNSIFEVVSGQTLQGIGTLKGILRTDAGSTFNVGLPTGSFTNTGSVELAGAVTMNVNATDNPNCSRLIASSITIGPTATLVVTNLGPEQTATFQLFNHPVKFNSVILPTLAGAYTWINNLAMDGSITMLPPKPPSSGPIGIRVVDGTNIIITATGGVQNGQFVLLQSTNLATPLTNWVPVLSNVFDGSGNLIVTNVLTPPVPPQEFYELAQ